MKNRTKKISSFDIVRRHLSSVNRRTAAKVSQSLQFFRESLAQINMSGTPKRSFWCCDQCNRTLNHGEFRYNCTVCVDYDYCEQCATTLEPPHPHRMVRELAYGRAAKMRKRRIDMATTIQAAFDKYYDRHCMGTRDDDTYSWLTFKTIDDRSKNFGHGLRQLIEPRGYLGLCAANRPEWMITDFACIFQSIISVPIYTLFTDREIAYVINNTKVSVICPSLEHIVCMDPLPNSISSKRVGLTSNDLSIHYMGDIERNGSLKKYDYVTTEPDDCLTIIYTSGSSGFPKGAMVSQRAFQAAYPPRCPSSTSDYIHFSYRPLAWVADRDAIIVTFLHGGRTAFSTGDLSRMTEELALVRPSDFAAAPSIWNKIYTEFNTALALITAQCPPEAIPGEENRLLEQFSKLIPNRCTIISIGGAMVSPVVLKFMKRCFTHCEIYESYGTTECGGVTYNNVVDGAVQYRLESVPEMNYTLEDQPYPRGELLTKTLEMFSGYINNPDETRAAITDDGFFRTGDIVELCTNQHGQTNIRVIDRKKSFFKLSQGQFVSPEHLQSIYIQSPFVAQIYIHGDLLADSVSAVVVPSRDYAQAYALEHHLSDFDINNPHPHFCHAVLHDLRSIGEKEALRPHEIPSRIIIDFNPFTSENGLLTSSMKQCRPKLAAHYAHRLRTPDSIAQWLKVTIERATGKSISTEKEENVFVSVGGDSLAAVRLSRMIENDLGVPLPLDIIFDPKMSVQRLTALIQDPRQLASCSSSIVPQLLNDCNLDLDIAVHGYKSSRPSPSLVLVTGSTGFVGAFLLAELLTSYPSNCQFVCLVRCDVSIDPLDRIRETMLFYQIWKDEYQHRIVALRGDLAQSHFGLDDDTYESIHHQTDVIFHCGATVNFVLPYSQLYGPNVCGTREIIRFATHSSSACIPIHYISTISVLSNDMQEKVNIDETSPDRLVSGYAQSKWVAEKLIWRASVIGVPVVIYRLGLICADSISGACNPRDLYTLLFDVMMKIGCYPESAQDGHVSGLPVDFTAKSVVHVSRVGADAYGKVYHVINSSGEIAFERIIDGMRRCGCEMRRVTNEEWKRKLKITSDRHNDMESLEDFFSHNVFSKSEVVSADQFRDAIRALDFPLLDEDYVLKWLHFVSHHIIRK